MGFPCRPFGRFRLFCGGGNTKATHARGQGYPLLDGPSVRLKYSGESTRCPPKAKAGRIFDSGLLSRRRVSSEGASPDGLPEARRKTSRGLSGRFFDINTARIGGTPMLGIAKRRGSATTPEPRKDAKCELCLDTLHKAIDKRKRSATLCSNPNIKFGCNNKPNKQKYANETHLRH